MTPRFIQICLKKENILLWIMALGLIFRLIPHIPNYSPGIALPLYVGAKFSRARAVFAVFLIAFISDILLGLIQKHEIIGSWSFFTYSATLVITILGFQIKQAIFKANFLMVGLLSTLGYWLWTNLGTWLFSSLYAHTISGFITCYFLALPFLGSAMLHSIVWLSMIVMFERNQTKNVKQHELVAYA